jgi:predicted Holliday junction resolvase-like endonuclease
MDKFIIVILIIAIVYILVLYFRCKRLDKIIEQHEKKLHDAAIILSAHKTVLINKTIKYSKDTRDVRIINRELDEEIAECCAYMVEHEEELINKANGEHIVKINKEDK